MLVVSVEPGVSYEAGVVVHMVARLSKGFYRSKQASSHYWRESFRCSVRAEIYKPSTQTVGRCDLY